MKKLISIVALLLWYHIAHTENYLINGGQESSIRYQMTQKVTPKPGIKMLYLSFVVPVSFNSPTYNQRLSDLVMDFSPQPNSRKEKVDDRGNKVIQVAWNQPTATINTTISLIAHNKVVLQSLNTSVPFPPTNLPVEVKVYLTATEQVPSGDPQIKVRAQQLIQGAKTQFDAVQRILSWVVDHMHYVLIPPQYDALYSFNTGKGNCQNYSHLAAALMRAVGIPARIVNGVTLKQPYTVKMGNRTMTLKMAEGRHSWIEVYFNDLGWVPFDPQQTELFVSNRFIRIEVGLDNNETQQDGLIRWTQSAGAEARPEFEEIIEANFVQDNVTLSAQKQEYGPRNMLFAPAVTASFQPYVTAPKPEPPKMVSGDVLQKMKFYKPYTFGNLEFPEGVDFLATRGPATKGAGEGYEMRKNFLVETAEYVTSQAQYAQIFVLEKPIKLNKIGLALHKFGGQGYLWVELLKDDNSKPGEPVATSAMISVDAMPFRPGYYWVDFDFSQDAPVLSPGRYWMALGFTGSPIVNWFFTYGKPVGPVDGTRYKTILAPDWSNSLAYEFNYRVQGLSSE